jgi:hypothetical protein
VSEDTVERAQGAMRIFRQIQALYRCSYVKFGVALCEIVGWLKPGTAARFALQGLVSRQGECHGEYCKPKVGANAR